MAHEVQPKPVAIIWLESQVHRLVQERGPKRAPLDANRLNRDQLHEVAKVSLNIFSRHPNPQIREAGLLILPTLHFTPENDKLADVCIDALNNVTAESPIENVTDVLKANYILSRYFPKRESIYRQVTFAVNKVAEVKKEVSLPLIEQIKKDFFKAIINSLQQFDPALIDDARKVLQLKLEDSGIPKKELQYKSGLPDNQFEAIYSELVRGDYIIPPTRGRPRKRATPSEEYHNTLTDSGPH